MRSHRDVVASCAFGFVCLLFGLVVWGERGGRVSVINVFVYLVIFLMPVATLWAICGFE